MRKTTLLVPVILFLLLGVVNCAKKNTSMVPEHLRPGSAGFLMNEGLMSLNAGDLAKAEAKFTQALRKNPTLYAALYAMGIVHLNRSDFHKARDFFSRSLKFKPDYMDTHNYLGIVYTELGNYDKAKEHLVIAANSDLYKTPENAYANLAMLEIRYKKYASARRYIEKGMTHNREFAPLYNAMGIVLENGRRYTEAIFYYEKALSLLKRDDLGYLINIGRVYSLMGQKNKALDTLERALSLAGSENVRANIRAMMRKLDR